MTRSATISASGSKNKGAFEQARMRQRQVRVVKNEVVIGEEVDIDPARTPTAFAAAVAAERAFNSRGCARADRAASSEVATAMAALMKGGWSVTPQGGVR